LLSRRLNFIALPIYFARIGVDLETWRPGLQRSR
jgi:hypothetical protein